MSDKLKVHTMSDYFAEGKTPEVLFWIGCAGSFDDRAKKITKAFVKILNSINVDFAVLGQEESCSGDPAKRAGNEFLFQMQAISNIEVLNSYDVKTIVTTCPHCFNTIKNEYPSLGGNYKVYHHTQFLKKLLSDGRLKIKGGSYKGKRITYHDPCYLGRHNRVFDEPREILSSIPGLEVKELERSRETSFCCGAGGGKIWMEEEAPRVNWNRFEEIEASGVETVAAACPFCNVMFEDAAKYVGNDAIKIKDIAELLEDSLDLPVKNSNFEKLIKDSAETEEVTENDDAPKV